jgi:hypothetical protein
MGTANAVAGALMSHVLICNTRAPAAVASSAMKTELA